MRSAAPSMILAAVLAAGCTGRDEPAPPPAGPVAAASPRSPEPPPPPDPAQLRRLAERDEARDRHRSLAETYARGGRGGAQARARLEGALRATAPALSWQVSCRGLVCRVSVTRGPQSWRGVLEVSAPVRHLADRVALDPEDAQAPAYVLLAAEGAAPGEELLSEVERALPASVAPRRCGARTTPPTVAVEIDLRVDPSGFTYRSGDAPAAILDCLDEALSEVFRGVVVPAGTRSASRKVEVRL